MLILLGGLMGSGRKVLAQQLATRRDFYLYDTDSKKFHLQEFQKDGSVKVFAQPARTQEQRTFLYKQIVNDLPRLSKMYPNMIIEDSFHRTAPRKFFVSEAEKYFDRVVFIWIDSDESLVADRIKRMEKSGMVRTFDEAVRLRRGAARHLEPDSSMLVFNCIEGNEVEADALWSLISGTK